VYKSPPLVEDLEVTGPVELVLYASSSAPDTDFAARLVDSRPDGRELLIASGLVRGRYRESLNRPSFLGAGRIYRFEISLAASSYVFAEGHRIGLYVSSSDFPKYDRSLNTAEDIGAGVIMVKASQSVFHGPHHPSQLVLPVIPNE